LKEILDTRFLVEYFYSNQVDVKNKIALKLKDMISRNSGILPTIVVVEITQITCEKRGKDMAESRYQALVQSGLLIQDLTHEIAKRAGILKSQHKNVPMGDCIIAATAIANNGKILSDDPHFDIIKEIKRNWI